MSFDFLNVILEVLVERGVWMKDKIYLDEKGYQDYLAEIETLKEQLVNMKAARFGLKSIYTDPDSLSEALEEHKIE